ncbi:MAG: Nramp family divalent metal transporter [Pirellulaceae bacterium]
MIDDANRDRSPSPDESTPDTVAPHPGSQQMPRWNTAELVDAPRFTARNWFSLLGPGLVMGAGAIGGGEWLVGPLVTAKYGGALMWLATLSILAQCLYNIEISRYTLYTGEPIFTGKFRTLPGPLFWVSIYLLLDLGVIFPYLAANAATPVAVVFLQGELPQPDQVASHWWMVKIIGVTIFILAMVPLVFGGKIYNTLRALMTAKLVIVVGFLLILAILYSHSASWVDICSGFVEIGNVPVQCDEDRNGNGVLDPGEDWDNDGHLDVVEPRLEPTIDTDGDHRPDAWESDADGRPIKFVDLDGDGYHDGENIENFFVTLFRRGELPDIDYHLIALIAALAAIAGNGGLANTPISNFTRDQGWGMGHHVGAIPSMIGGRNIALSHVGSVFLISAESLPRWRRWYRCVVRDQLCVWVPACVIGVALPAMLSVEFLRRGTDADDWNAAAMTAVGVGEQVANPPPDVLASLTGFSQIFAGEVWGNLFWAMTLFCGFMVLGPSTSLSVDGIIRRWVDAFWTVSPRLRKLEPALIKQVYFRVLVVYGLFGIIMLWLNKPTSLIKIATLGYNFAFGFSCWHTLAVNTFLLPRELRPRWYLRLGLILAGLFFTLLGILATVQTLTR